MQKLKMTTLKLAVAAGLGMMAYGAQATWESGEMIIVHPFQWTYDNIAKECTEVLGPKGFDGVQISQPAEHIARTDVWWAVYQPVNFKNFTTMTGNEQQLRNMIKTCNAAGVKVFADAVFNQRGSAGNKGLGGSGFNGNGGSAWYPDGFTKDNGDFHNPCDISYDDPWKIRNCALSGMPDIATDNDSTRAKIANYLQSLLDMGVTGFRIDAAKHMYPKDIDSILSRVGYPPSYLEVIGAGGEPVQPTDYTWIPGAAITEFKYCDAMMKNINQPKYLIDMNDQWFQVAGNNSEVFVNNHDNERGSAGTKYMTYEWGQKYHLAQSFLVAYPQGAIRQVYSGYQFHEHDPAGPIGADRCQGGWLCQHRNPLVANAVSFARATRGEGVTNKGSEGQAIWFSRGSKGFYALNTGSNSVTKTVKTGMPDGEYCQILNEDKCAQKIKVSGGQVTFTVNGESAIAICTDALYCGAPVPPKPCNEGGPCTCEEKPEQDKCNVPTPELYYAGTSNGWTFTKMECADHKCTVKLTLDDKGDTNGKQRFKITSASNWKGQVFGTNGSDILCSDQASCKDISLAGKSGVFDLTVNTDTMKWSIAAHEETCDENPDQDKCHVTPPSDCSMSALYFAGSNNNWTFDAMTCNKGKWEITYDFTGEGEKAGKVQRFKVTSDANWKGKVYGAKSGSSNQLCSDQSVCNDVVFSNVGKYKIIVDESKMTWTSVKIGDDVCQAPSDAMYFAGTTNKWTFDKMSWDCTKKAWTIGLSLTGKADTAGSQRFKITSAADWKHDVWGKQGSNTLCKDQSKCGDVYISEQGDYTLLVDPATMSWTLVKTEQSCKENPNQAQCTQTCEENPNQDKCQQTCEQNPNQDKCQQTCEQNPNQAKCEQTCEQNPNQDKCQQTCEQNPNQAGCQIIDDPCKANPQSCEGYPNGPIDSAECAQQCKDVEKEVCTGAGNGTVSQDGLTSVAYGPYGTNPNGQVGQRKTISSVNDWTEDMIIARGAANDDPRSFRGYHEKATDLYALYAAWDSANLYLMVEMPNLQNVDVLGDFNYANDQFLPMGIALNTGKRTAGNGLNVEGNTTWMAGQFYDIKAGIDTLLMFHPRPTAGTPGLFLTNDEGLFSYDAKGGYLIGFDKAGIKREITEGKTISQQYLGSADNYGKNVSSYKGSSFDNLLKGDATGHLYQVTIPLASLGITADWIEQHGIKAMAFSTFGESMMDALPWSENLIDKASDPYSKDDSTSAEKEDIDVYDVPLASIGVLSGSSSGEKVCNTVVEQQCETSTLPQCTADIKVSVTADTSKAIDNENTYVVPVSVYTGYTGVNYTWTPSAGSTVTSKYDETTHSFAFAKKAVAYTATVKVQAANASMTRSGYDSVKIEVPACANCGVASEWAEVLTDQYQQIPAPSNCKAPENSLILKADSGTAPNAYVYTKSTESAVAGKWPGSAMTKLDGCEGNFWSLTPSKTDDLLVIFNGVNGERFPADMQPGAAFSVSSPCFDWSGKTFTSVEACGMTPAVNSDRTYVIVNSEKKTDGTITVSQVDGADSAYVDVSLMIAGEGVDGTTEGTYTIDGKSYAFVNGQKIRVAQGVNVSESDPTAETTLTVEYNGVSSTFTVQKKFRAVSTGNAFSWNNALVYFVITDRFQNGDKQNDNSFGRPYKDTNGHATATFHGGDIKGLTERLDYIKSLGMNAIWLTAPYEQSHGWTGGGSSGAFAHYAYHGYYGLDWTAMDPNMGTVEEFRTFVKEAHKRGIRVVMDIVMNHSGYATLKDMCDFGFGKTKDGWNACNDWKGSNFHQKPIDESQNSAWDKWWGKNWLIFGGYGENCGSGDGLNACVSYLPDFKNSQAHGNQVAVPQFLQSKWSKFDAKYDVPAAKQYRSGNMSVAEFQAHWLASWVEEFGVDGFRCDTAKHVTKETWKLLKEYSQEALEKWRNSDKSSDDPAAAWTDGFWMTGEHFGFRTDPTDGSQYASQGGFDSMINFQFNGNANGGSCSVPNANSWNTFAGMYGVGSGSPKLNALTYVSSHDTSLCRPSDMKNLGTYLELLPGGVQVYYGDETARRNDNGGSGNDAEHGTRSDMNFPSDIGNQADWAANVDTLSTSFSKDATLAHWQKVGQFRFRNVAVGAGKQTQTADGSYCRVYDDQNTGISNAVVIHVGNASTIDVGNCFIDGTQVQDGYSGATGTVSGGKVKLSGTGDLVLIEVKR